MCRDNDKITTVKTNHDIAITKPKLFNISNILYFGNNIDTKYIKHLINKAIHYIYILYKLKYANTHHLYDAMFPYFA